MDDQVSNEEVPTENNADDEPIEDAGSPAEEAEPDRVPSPEEDLDAHNRKFAELRRKNDELMQALDSKTREQEQFIAQIEANPRAYQALMNPEEPDYVPDDVKGNEHAERIYGKIGELEATQQKLARDAQVAAANAAKAGFDASAQAEASRLGVPSDRYAAFKRQTLALARETPPRSEAQARELFAQAAKELGISSSPTRKPPHVPASSTRRGGGPVATEPRPKGKEERIAAIAQRLREQEGMT
jgi:hypothetical protein